MSQVVSLCGQMCPNNYFTDEMMRAYKSSVYGWPHSFLEVLTLLMYTNPIHGTVGNGKGTWLLKSMHMPIYHEVIPLGYRHDSAQLVTTI